MGVPTSWGPSDESPDGVSKCPDTCPGVLALRQTGPAVRESGPASWVREGARGGRGEVLGTAASRVPAGLRGLCSAHLKCIQDTHLFWILFLVLRRLFSMLLLTAAPCQPARGRGAQRPPLLLPAGDFPSAYLQPPPGPPGGSSHGAADFKGGALWSPDRERSSPFFGGCMMSRSTHAPSSRALN